MAATTVPKGSFKAAITDPGLAMATTTDPLRWVIDRRLMRDRPKETSVLIRRSKIVGVAKVANN